MKGLYILDVALGCFLDAVRRFKATSIEQMEYKDPLGLLLN